MVDHQVIISNKEAFDSKVAALKAAGVDSLHVVSDFDKTLTMGYVGGERCISSYQIIRDVSDFHPEYVSKSTELKIHYKPLEHDNNLSYEKRYELMQEWWTKHWDLMVSCGINQATITKAITHPMLKMRDGVMQFFSTLWKADVPLLILSAGCGNVIEGKLKQISALTQNVHLIDNRFFFGEDGAVTGHSSPMITSMNKDETNVKNHSYYNSVKERRNVILIGDSLGDLDMAKGLDHDVVLSIGFLNTEVESRLESYTKHFDVVLLGDPGMNYVNDLLSEIF